MRPMALFFWTGTVELRYNKVPRGLENVFVITGVRYIGVMFAYILQPANTADFHRAPTLQATRDGVGCIRRLYMLL